MKATYVLDANRKVIARHFGAHDETWGHELRQHYDSAIAAAEFPYFQQPCSVVLVDPDPCAAVGEVLPS